MTKNAENAFADAEKEFAAANRVYNRRATSLAVKDSAGVSQYERLADVKREIAHEYLKIGQTFNNGKRLILKTKSMFTRSTKHAEALQALDEKEAKIMTTSLFVKTTRDNKSF